jgi:opacity protein-like surface antigen
MKTILATILVVSCVTLPLLAEEAKQALIVEAPATWKVEFKGGEGWQLYTVTQKDNGAFLQFSQSPGGVGNVNQIPEQIEAMAKKFAERAKYNKGLKLNSKEYKIEEIAGDTFSGSFVQFEIEGGFTQTMFMIGNAEGIWNGQFRGKKELWAEARSLLKKLKKKG